MESVSAVINLSEFNLLLEENGVPIRDGNEVYLQRKADDTVFKVPLKDVKAFYNITENRAENTTPVMTNKTLAVTTTSVVTNKTPAVTTNREDTFPESTSIQIPNKIKYWSKESILLLIKLREKYDGEFRSTTMKNDKCWHLVVKDLEQEGYISSVNQCRDKWKYLKEKYTKKKDNMSIRCSGAEYFKFDYFEEMDNFLGKRANIEPVALASSSNGNKNFPDEAIDDTILELETNIQTPQRKKRKKDHDPIKNYIEELKRISDRKEEEKKIRHQEILEEKKAARQSFEEKMDKLLGIIAKK